MSNDKTVLHAKQYRLKGITPTGSETTVYLSNETANTVHLVSGNTSLYLSLYDMALVLHAFINARKESKKTNGSEGIS